MQHLLVPDTSFPDSVKNRFFSRVRLPNKNGCMEWIGGNHKRGGYGGFHTQDKKFFTAHRYSYELFNGEIPEGMFVLHKCDNKMCVAPAHLFLGTQQDNMIDMRSKNRGYSTKGENHGLSKLTLESVKEIRQSHASGKISLTALALQFSVSVSTIHSIVNNNSWRNL